MGKQKTDRRRTALKKETIRTLDHAALSPDALRQVVGGGYKASYPCATSM